jgi:hypothetical protein
VAWPLIQSRLGASLSAAIENWFGTFLPRGYPEEVTPFVREAKQTEAQKKNGGGLTNFVMPPIFPVFSLYRHSVVF